MTPRALAIDALGNVEESGGASQANGLGSAEAPEPHAGLGPTGAIPSAVFDAVAHQFSYDMGLAISGNRLRRNYDMDGGNIRSAAVASVDGCHGYTCEFSSCPAQHIAEYDALEELLTSAIAEIGGAQ